MSTSNSVDFNLTAQEIITQAYRKLGVIRTDTVASGSLYSHALINLNAMIKSWQSMGIHLWTESLAYIFITAGQSSYKFGGTSPDRIASESIKTELSADEASGETVLSVDDSTNMAAADVVGIELDDGTLQWTTIVSVDSSTQITVTDALTDDASSGNNIYAYTSAVTQRPYKIKSMRLIQDSGSEILMSKLSREQYLNIANKASTAQPTQYYVDRQRDHTRIFVYGTANHAKDRLVVSYSRLIEDFDNSTDDQDFPQEWLEAMYYNLAVRLAPEHQKEGKIGSGPGSIADMAMQTLRALAGDDQEDAVLTITPNLY